MGALSDFQNLYWFISVLRGERLLSYRFPHSASKDELMEVDIPCLFVRGTVTNERRASRSHYIEISVARIMPSALNFPFLQAF